MKNDFNIASLLIEPVSAATSVNQAANSVGESSQLRAHRKEVAVYEGHKEIYTLDYRSRRRLARVNCFTPGSRGAASRSKGRGPRSADSFPGRWANGRLDSGLGR